METLVIEILNVTWPRLEVSDYDAEDEDAEIMGPPSISTEEDGDVSAEVAANGDLQPAPGSPKKLKGAVKNDGDHRRIFSTLGPRKEGDTPHRERHRIVRSNVQQDSRSLVYYTRSNPVRIVNVEDPRAVRP